MMSAMVWKEYREHRMVWIVLAFFGAATVLGLSSLNRAGWFGPAPDNSNGNYGLWGIAVFLVGVYALICGAMMLAGERENGALPYLDALPGLRRRLWQGKFLAGVLLVLAQIVLLMSLSAVALWFRNWIEVALAFGVMLAAGLYGLSWGLLFSSFTRNVMNAILLSLAGLVALGFFVGISAVVFVIITSAITGAELKDGPPGVFIGAFYAVIPLAALAGSALVFTRLDRSRLRPVSETLPSHKRVLRRAWPMLFWLEWRQARGFAAGIATFAIFLGLVILLNGLILWPMATLVIGALCGATAFADEQQGPFRFLGDQRLPLGRLWVVKVGLRFGIAVAAALVMLAPSFVITATNFSNTPYDSRQPFYLFAHLFHSHLLVDLVPPGLFLTLWLVYGFSAGCLFGLLFRHGLAAGVFALFASAMTAVLWIPSLLVGGLHAWQVIGPPLLIIASTRLLMRPWAAGRIASWTTAKRLTPFVMLAGLWLAGGLWYRVFEIPDVPMNVDLEAFRASLPSPEQNEGGRLFHSACLRFNTLRSSLEAEEKVQGVAPGMRAAAPGAPGQAFPPDAVAEQAQALPPVQRAAKALDDGWPADDHALAIWLDKVYAGDWLPMLKKAAELPTGPFDDVRNATEFTSLQATQETREVAVVLVMRALQRQAAGDEAAFVENLRICLALSRSLRDRTPAPDVTLGRVVELVVIKGVDRWLEKLQGRPDLIRQALDLLSHHLEARADDDQKQEWVDDLITKNTVDDEPLRLLQMYLDEEPSHSEIKDNLVREEALWAATAWLVPWEHARQARILRVMFSGDWKQHAWLYGPGKGYGPLPQLGPYRNDNRYRRGEECMERAALLKLALRCYLADNGKSADNLEELVPKYLQSLPLDPFDGEPFRYRLSHGEEIEWPPALDNAGPLPTSIPTRRIPAGQGILWSVGKDGLNDGGRRQSSKYKGETAPGEDFIFLVPLPPKAK